MFFLFPISMKFFLLAFITKVIKAHVHSFVSMLYNYVSGNPVGKMLSNLIGVGTWMWPIECRALKGGTASLTLTNPDTVSDS